MNKEIDTIINELFPEYDINADDEIKNDFWYDLSNKQKYEISAIHLKRIGNPDYDYLICWEPGRFDTDVKVTDFDTMYKIDVDWWEFQKKSQFESIEDSKKRMEKNPEKYTPEQIKEYHMQYDDQYGEYSIYLTGDWYRLIENNIFLYSQFISAKWFLMYEAEDVLDTLQEKNIPYDFSNNIFESLKETDPKKIYNANGREHELVNYQTDIASYKSTKLQNRIKFIISKYSKVFAGSVFRRDRGYNEESFDPFTDFIFFDENSLKKVSPKNFLKTFNACEIDFKEFQILIDDFNSMVESDFYEIYNENRSRYI